MADSTLTNTAESNSWLTLLKNYANSDLLKLEEDRRLNYDGHSISLHWLDRVSLLLVRQAYIQSKSLVICYPIPGCNLPILASAQLLIYDLIKNKSNKLSILLISSRIDFRHQYLKLRIEREPIAAALPIARIRDAHEPAIIPLQGITRYSRPALYHLSRPYLIEQKWPKDIGCVIVDHNNGDFDNQTDIIYNYCLRQRISTVIHFCTDPFASFLNDLKEKGKLIWVWDHSCLKYEFMEEPDKKDLTDYDDHPFGMSSQQFNNILNGIGHNLLICNHPDLEKVARRVWDDLATVQASHAVTTNYGLQKAVRAAYSVFYSMLLMLVPLPIYEEESRNLWGVRPIARRIKDLEAFTAIIRDESPDLAEVFWPSLVLDLRDMAQALAVENPKYKTLVRLIREHINAGKKISIVCPNQASKRMLLLCLRAKEGIHINDVSLRDDTLLELLTYKELNSCNSTQVLVFPGQFSFGRRQYLFTAAAPEIHYLAYSDEADRIEQQVIAVHQATYDMADPGKRKATWDILVPSSAKMDKTELFQDYPPLQFDITRSTGERTSRRTVSSNQINDMSLWTPFTTTEYDVQDGKDVLGDESEIDLRPSEFADLERQNVFVPAIKINFSDGYCYAEPDSKMTVLLSATEKTDIRRADGLQPNDIVIFVNGDQRKQLYEAILERVERHPSMGVTYILVRYWQQAVREGFFRSGMTYDAFLMELQRQGSKMSTAPGVRCWVVGEVLGPSDKNDIRRVGTILNDGVLLQEWKNIDRSLRTIRGIHVSLSRKLNKIIVEAGLRGNKPDSSDECIDQTLNLYLDDFRDSVTLHYVSSVEQKLQSVPYIYTGKFFSREDVLSW